MDSTHLASLLRFLATTPSRRGVTRALAGSALAGALIPIFGSTEADAKKHKKKKRRRRKKKRRQQPQPFCAGKNICVDVDLPICDTDATCTCYVTAETGDPFCGIGTKVVGACTECTAGETCIDISGPYCADARFACADPCPNPL